MPNAIVFMREYIELYRRMHLERAITTHTVDAVLMFLLPPLEYWLQIASQQMSMIAHHIVRYESGTGAAH